MELRRDADKIIADAIGAVLPDEAVKRALAGKNFGSGRTVMVAIGKAAWQMANTAAAVLGRKLSAGIVITKYGHVKGDIPGCRCYEAGHPIPDENSFAATRAALALVADLTAADTVLFLVSGGGSALFEAPLIDAAELASLTSQLMACGADIAAINTLRKRWSAVKGGRFGALCAPARVFSIVLSDVIGDRLDVIASGPAYPDSSTSEQAQAIVKNFSLRLSPEASACLSQETPKELTNVETVITGSVQDLCRAAGRAAQDLGYRPIFLTDRLTGEAREAGNFLVAIAAAHQDSAVSLAYIAGGETVVHLTGTGKGGRNQEIALAAAVGLSGLKNTAVFSVGSDGTDGPTDAAGGYADERTAPDLLRQGVDIGAALKNNDAYNALKKSGGLIITGPTGTNVNDVAVVLIKRH